MIWASTGTTSLNSGMLLAAGALVLVTYSLILVRRAQARRQNRESTPREVFDRYREEREIRASLDELMIQLEELSRRITAQVDTRFAKLEAVIRDADDRTAHLQTLLDRTGTRHAPHAAGSHAPPSPDPHDRTGAPGATFETRDAAEGPERGGSPAAPRRATAGPHTRKRPDDTSPAPDPQAPADADGQPSSGHAAPPREPPPLHARVYALADAGTRPIDIAERLGIVLGEVELILNLRRL